MGARGPKPLPSNVLALRGSWRAKAQNNEGRVEPEIEIPGCPKHLLPEAKKEWRRIGPELHKLGLISRLDRTALGMYCQAYAHLVWHEQMLERDKRLAAERQAAHEAREESKRIAVAAKRAAAGAADADGGAEAAEGGESYMPAPWTGGDGFMLPTPNGSFMYNPHWVARNKMVGEVDKMLASFGMSPSSRGRVSPSSNQMALFEDGDKGGFKVF